MVTVFIFIHYILFAFLTTKVLKTEIEHLELSNFFFSEVCENNPPRKS